METLLTLVPLEMIGFGDDVGFGGIDFDIGEDNVGTEIAVFISGD